MLSAPEKLGERFAEHKDKIENLLEMCAGFLSPEHIDDGPDTAPSKRIIGEVPEYEGVKASAGPIIAKKIGLQMIRSKCLHFDGWLKRLEHL